MSAPPGSRDPGKPSTANPPPATPDAVRFRLIENLPPALLPFAQMARLDRPIGWWLLLLPCWWSTAIAARMAEERPSLITFALFLVGAIAMRGAGSTWNDITDRDLDAKVARTRARPLPSGRITLPQAFMFLALQCLIGLAVLLAFNRFAVLMGFLALLPVIVYPFMKRVSFHPQIVLGLAFAWGALMGFAVELGSLPWAAYLLYAGAILWVIGYDTIYALQDIEDDEIAGIGSTARAYGDKVGFFIALIYAGAVIVIGMALVAAGASWFAWAGLAGFASHLGWQLWRLDRTDPNVALRLFRSNRDCGLILFTGLWFDALIRF